MIAVDIATGKVLWKTPNPHDWNMTHSSIVPVEFGGKKMFVYCGSGGGAGISADDGKLLWEPLIGSFPSQRFHRRSPLAMGKFSCLAATTPAA